MATVIRKLGNFQLYVKGPRFFVSEKSAVLRRKEVSQSKAMAIDQSSSFIDDIDFELSTGNYEEIDL